MTGGHDAGTHQLGKVANRVTNSLLHRCAREVVTPENNINRHLRTQRHRSQTRIHHTGVRARGQHRHTTTTYMGGKEPFVDDEWIGLATFTSERVVPDQTGLVSRDPLNGTTAHKKTTDRMGYIAGDNSPTSRLHLAEGRFGRQQRHHPRRQQHAALIGPIGMHIDNRSG